MSKKMCTLPVALLDYSNLNNRIYTKKAGDSIIEQFKNLELPAYGELSIYNHNSEIDLSVVSLSNVSHIVKNLTYDFSNYFDQHRNYLEDKKTIIIADIEFLENEKGEMAYNMLDSLALSLRGYGRVEPHCYVDPATGELEGECLGLKVSDYILESIDFVLKRDSSFRDVFR